MGLFGPPDVAKLEAKGDVPGLVRALGYGKDWAHERLHAGEALSRIGAPAVERLIAALREPRVRKEAVRVLGMIGDARAVEPISAALKDENQYLRGDAAEALGKIGDARAVEPLLAVLEEGESPAKGNVVMALGYIGDPRAVEPLGAVLAHEDGGCRKGAIQALGMIGGARAVELLIIALEDEDPYRRGDAAEALGKMGPSAALAAEPLTAALQDEHVRPAAANALVEIGTPAIEPLITVLGDKNRSVRRAGIDALIKIGAPTVEPLVAFLNNAALPVRVDAAIVLNGLGWQPDRTEAGAACWMASGQWEKCVEIGAPAVAPLIATVVDPGESDGYRGLATGALGRIRDARAVGPLIAVLRTRSEQDALREAAVDALGCIAAADADAVDPIAAVLQDSDWTLRRDAAAVLGRSIDRRAVDPLVAAVRDLSPDVRQAVAVALAALGWTPSSDQAEAVYYFVAQHDWAECVRLGGAAVEPLVSALTSYSDPATRNGVARALGEIADPRAIDALVAALPVVGQTGAEALARIAGPRAVGPLITCLHGSDWGMRKVAAEALAGMYQAGCLDESGRQGVLAAASTITKTHIDGAKHTDEYADPVFRSSDCGLHTDGSGHEDEGIGVPFPV